MLARIFDNLARQGQLDSRWVAAQLSHLDRLDGDIDTLMTRIAHIRTWTYITHKTGWTDAKQDWQELAKSIEDRLSDELHNRLYATVCGPAGGASVTKIKGIDDIDGICKT